MIGLSMAYMISIKKEAALILKRVKRERRESRSLLKYMGYVIYDLFVDN